MGRLYSRHRPHHLLRGHRFPGIPSSSSSLFCSSLFIYLFVQAILRPIIRVVAFRKERMLFASSESEGKQKLVHSYPSSSLPHHLPSPLLISLTLFEGDRAELPDHSDHAGDGWRMRVPGLPHGSPRVRQQLRSLLLRPRGPHVHPWPHHQLRLLPPFLYVYVCEW